MFEDEDSSSDDDSDDDDSDDNESNKINEPDINLNQENNEKTRKNNVFFNCGILLSLVMVAFQWLRNLTKSCKEEYED